MDAVQSDGLEAPHTRRKPQMTQNEIATIPTQGIRSLEDAWKLIAAHVGPREQIGVDRFDRLGDALYHRALSERASPASA